MERKRVAKKQIPSKSKKSEPQPTPSSPDVWRSSPDLIRKFIESRPDYEQLCSEVSYILEKRLGERRIEVASISHRAKKLESFLEKFERKSYGSPLDEITDLAGVRVVCLYVNDIAEIEGIVEKEFIVFEKIDKIEEKGTDRFGYNAMHFLVRLGKGSAGARYDDLRQLTCEIQVRTVLQDAWSIIQHHLVYKRESEVPHQLQRRLNSLAGLLETADDQFERIRDDRNSYVSAVKESVGKPEVFLESKVDLDTVREYLTWKFPGKPLQKFDRQLSSILSAVNRERFSTLKELDTAINNTQETRAQLFEKLEEPEKTAPDGIVPAAVELAWALSIIDQSFRKRPLMPDSWEKALETIVKNEQA